MDRNHFRDFFEKSKGYKSVKQIKILINKRTVYLLFSIIAKEKDNEKSEIVTERTGDHLHGKICENYLFCVTFSPC